MQSIKTMLFGMIIIILGGFILADPGSNLGGLEFLIMLIGLAISSYGYVQDLVPTE